MVQWGTDVEKCHLRVEDVQHVELVRMKVGCVEKCIVPSTGCLHSFVTLKNGAKYLFNSIAWPVFNCTKKIGIKLIKCT